MSITGEVSRARKKKINKYSQAVITNREKSAEVIVTDKVKKKKSAVGEGLNF